MENKKNFLLVVLFPTIVSVVVALISLSLWAITSLEFYTISMHPITWMMGIVLTVVGYISSL